MALTKLERIAARLRVDQQRRLDPLSKADEDDWTYLDPDVRACYLADARCVLEALADVAPEYFRVRGSTVLDGIDEQAATIPEEPATIGIDWCAPRGGGAPSFTLSGSKGGVPLTDEELEKVRARLMDLYGLGFAVPSNPGIVEAINRNYAAVAARDKRAMTATEVAERERAEEERLRREEDRLAAEALGYYLSDAEREKRVEAEDEPKTGTALINKIQAERNASADVYTRVFERLWREAEERPSYFAGMLAKVRKHGMEKTVGKQSVAEILNPRLFGSHAKTRPEDEPPTAGLMNDWAKAKATPPAPFTDEEKKEMRRRIFEGWGKPRGWTIE